MRNKQKKMQNCLENSSNYFFVDTMVDSLGEMIERLYPLIENLDVKSKNLSPEYRLLNNIWNEWEHYLEEE